MQLTPRSFFSKFHGLFLFLIFSSSLFALPDQMDRKEGLKQMVAREEERCAFEGQLLYLTSSLTNVFSNQVFFLNSLNHGLRIFNQRTDNVNVGYDFGGSFSFRYRIPPSRNDIETRYTYVHSSGSDSVKRDITDEAFGVIQHNVQNDSGKLHAHLHIFDLLVGHGFPFYKYLLLKFGGGLTVNDFHYFFAFKNSSSIVNTSLAGQEVSFTRANVSSSRKFRFVGWGPKVGVHFGYHFLSPYSPHEFSLYSVFEFSILFSRKWSKGGYSGQVISSEAGAVPTLPLAWEDHPEARIISHMHLGFNANYRYYFENGVSLSLIAGYKSLVYWDLDEVNRVINYNLETLISIAPRAESDTDSMIFSGPYVGLEVAF